MAQLRPLKERLLSTPAAQVTVASPYHCGRLPYYREWTTDKMEKAIEAVHKGTLSVRRASEIYSIPKSTLHDRISGKVVQGASSGPEPYLTITEETELVQFLTKCASMGFARSKKQIFDIVDRVLESKGKNVKVSNGWWQSFRNRNPNMVLRTSEPLSYIRAVSSSPEIINHYFDLLESTIVDNCLLGKPSQIFSMDETGMPLDPNPPFVVAPVGTKHVSCMRTGDKSQITVIACCNAAGYAMPPTVVFDRKQIRQELTYGEIPGTTYAGTGNGWVNAEIFDSWFSKHFLAHAPSTRPLLLLLDGHSSHFEPGALHLAAENGVIIFCLPPNTTHLTQPLDKGCFGPLKVYWKEECQTYLSKNPGKVVTRYQFSEILAKAWAKVMTMKNIIGGFKTTGVYPMNREAIIPKSSPVKKGNTFDTPSLPKETGIKFLPLHSPFPSQKSRSKDRLIGDVTMSPTVSDVKFTVEELALFKTRFEEGYDIVDDSKYNAWLQKFHSKQLSDDKSRADTPSDGSSCHYEKDKEDDTVHLLKPDKCSTTTTDDDNDCIMLCHSTVLSKCIKTAVQPKIKVPTAKITNPARVLTSHEHLQLVTEKEEKRKQEARMKEKRRIEREQKQREKLSIKKKKEDKRQAELKSITNTYRMCKNFFEFCK